MGPTSWLVGRRFLTPAASAGARRVTGLALNTGCHLGAAGEDRTPDFAMAGRDVTAIPQPQLVLLVVRAPEVSVKSMNPDTWVKGGNAMRSVAPGTGLEPVTFSLTGSCTTIVLPRIAWKRGRDSNPRTCYRLRFSRTPPSARLGHLSWRNGGESNSRTCHRLRFSKPLPYHSATIPGRMKLLRSTFPLNSSYLTEPASVNPLSVKTWLKLFGGPPGTRTPNSWMPSKCYPVSLAARALTLSTRYCGGVTGTRTPNCAVRKRRVPFSTMTPVLLYPLSQFLFTSPPA